MVGWLRSLSKSSATTPTTVETSTWAKNSVDPLKIYSQGSNKVKVGVCCDVECLGKKFITTAI
jgi:hypothetical protein